MDENVVPRTDMQYMLCDRGRQPVPAVITTYQKVSAEVQMFCHQCKPVEELVRTLAEIPVALDFVRSTSATLISPHQPVLEPGQSSGLQSINGLIPLSSHGQARQPDKVYW